MLLSVRKWMFASGIHLLSIRMRQASTTVLGATALGMSLGASAMVLTPAVQITKFHAYTDYNNGDIAFNVDTTIAGCDGFWLSPADPGFKNVYAALLMAKASGMPVVVYAYDTQLWPGSGDKYCRVRTLSPQ